MKKKWIVIGVVIVLVAVLAGYFIGQGGPKSEEERLIEELTKGELDVSVPDGDYIEQKEGIEVKHTVKEGKLKKLGVFDFEVKVTNTSDRVLEKAEFVYTVYDGDGNVIGEKDTLRRTNTIYNLGPGESVVLNAEAGVTGVGTFIEVSKFEYTLRNVQWVKESTPLPEQPEEKEQPEEENVYSVSNYPKDPETPVEIAVAFYGLINDGEYEKAVMLSAGARNATKEQIKERAEELRMAIEKMWFKGRVAESVTMSPPIEGTGPRGEFVQFPEVIFHFTDGSKEETLGMILTKEGEEWKIGITWRQ